MAWSRSDTARISSDFQSLDSLQSADSGLMDSCCRWSVNIGRCWPRWRPGCLPPSAFPVTIRTTLTTVRTSVRGLTESVWYAGAASPLRKFTQWRPRREPRSGPMSGYAHGRVIGWSRGFRSHSDRQFDRWPSKLTLMRGRSWRWVWAAACPSGATRRCRCGCSAGRHRVGRGRDDERCNAGRA